MTDITTVKQRFGIIGTSELLDRALEVAVRVAVRGMMPRNIVTKDSLKRLHIYAGEQHEHQAQKPELVK